jgi:hypothetical protein
VGWRKNRQFPAFDLFLNKNSRHLAGASLKFSQSKSRITGFSTSSGPIGRPPVGLTNQMHQPAKYKIQPAGTASPTRQHRRSGHRESVGFARSQNLRSDMPDTTEESSCIQPPHKAETILQLSSRIASLLLFFEARPSTVVPASTLNSQLCHLTDFHRSSQPLFSKKAGAQQKNGSNHSSTACRGSTL